MLMMINLIWKTSLRRTIEEIKFRFVINHPFSVDDIYIYRNWIGDYGDKLYTI